MLQGEVHTFEAADEYGGSQPRITRRSYWLRKLDVLYYSSFVRLDMGSALFLIVGEVHTFKAANGTGAGTHSRISR